MHNTQVDYLLCNILYNLTSVLETFPCKELQEEINQTLLLIQNKSLNVAIIGEFRRGKSSLINALLGMPVLPVDIEPTTAAINRVTYGLKPRAKLHFKDGSSSEIPIEELSNYVTKLTPSSAKIAATIKEAEIQYPTELCSNHIDIIDTPGLNDTESMTSVTESLLDDIHIAIVAIKSTMPYSETECHWVTKLLALPKLNHIAFVLTCMDLVKKSDVQKVLTYTKQRICEKTLESVRSQYKDNPELILKAERLLSEKDFLLYPVSAALALESFDTGDYELLTESNISSLKKGLLTTMNTQQQMVGVYATERVIDRLSSWFASVSLDDRTKALSKQMVDLSNADTFVSAYFADRSMLIDKTMKTVDSEIAKLLSAWLSEDNIENTIRKIFIKHLSAVTINTNEAIAIAIRNTESDVLENVLLPLADGLRKAVNATIIRSTNGFFSDREERLHYTDNHVLIEESGIPSSANFKALIIEQLQDGLKIDLPNFSVSIPHFLMNQNIMQTLIAPYISLFAKKYRKAWQNALPEYTQKWYSIVLQAEPIELCNKFRNVVYSRKGAVTEKTSSLETQYRKAKLLIDEENNKVKRLKEDMLV